MAYSRSFVAALSLALLVATPALADTAPAGGSSDPSFTAHFFVGPGFGMGSRLLVQTRTRSTTTTATTPGTNASTTTTASSSITTSSLENGLGVVYGADLTWWASPEFGLGLDLFGGDVGSGQSATILGLNGQAATSYQNTSTSATGATTTTFTQTDTTTISPAVGGAPAYTVTIGIPAAGAQGTLSTTYSESGVGDIFKLQQGDSANTNPKNSFSSTGGMQFANTQSLWVNDLGLSGTYALWRGARGLVSLFGGMTLPVLDTRSASTATTVGANGSGATAEQVETAFDASGSVAATQTTDTTLNNSVSTDNVLIALGPVVGVDAAYDVTSNLHVYTQIGYAPVLDGSMQSDGTVSSSTKTVVTTTGVTASGTALGFANGTSTTSTSTSNPGQAIANVTGSETMATLGAQYDLAQFGSSNLGVYGELVARDYVFAGAPEAVYGLRIGAGLGF